MSGRLLNKHRDDISGAICIMRGTPWGNPFNDGTRESRIARFEELILPNLDLTPLLGHDIYCCCHPKPCHGGPILWALYRGL